ncbi:hypothetical protein QTP88_006731 [Uroleucon formosanum]
MHGLCQIEWQTFRPQERTTGTLCQRSGFSVFRVKLWTSAKQSVVQHIGDLHEEADSTVVRCVGCRSVLGIRPGAHKCGIEIEAAEDVVGQHACTLVGCEMSFPTKQGLSNHLRNHRRQVIIEAAAVPLPMPATRQRLRANPAPIPTRGGDTCAPVAQAADVPRIPAGDRPPETGGTFPLPSTSATEPRIPAGNRPPDTGGTPLSRTPSMQPISTRRATPVRPRGIGDRLSLHCCLHHRPVTSHSATRGTTSSLRARSSGGRVTPRRSPVVALPRVALQRTMMSRLAVCQT